jgi:hypothetical protein
MGRMKSSLIRNTSLTGLACLLALAGCNSAKEDATPPAGSAPPSSAATSAPAATPEPTEAPQHSNTGPAVKPPAGFGNAQGRVLFNEKPAVGVKVSLCKDFSFMGGCSGKTYDAKTDKDGNYTVDKVPPGDYSLAVRVFDTDMFIYPTTGIISAAKFTVKEGETLDIRATNLFKSDLQILSPRAGDIVKTGTPTLSWKPYPDAANYEVDLQGATSTEPQNIKTAQTKAPVETPLLNGTYAWKVTAFNANGVKLAETRDRSPFKVVGQAASSTITLLTPVTGTAVAGDKVKFSWKAHPLATSYQIYLNGTKGEPPVLSFQTVDGTSYTLDKPLAPGQYFWSVQAMKGDKKVSASELVSFRVK